jgi:hypothetical protein
MKVWRVCGVMCCSPDYSHTVLNGRYTGYISFAFHGVACRSPPNCGGVMGYVSMQIFYLVKHVVVSVSGFFHLCRRHIHGESYYL